MKRIFASIFVLALSVCLFALGSAWPRGQSKQRAGLTPAVQAQEVERTAAADNERAAAFPRSRHCTNGTVAGTFAYHATGTVTRSPAPQIPAGPFTTVGLLTFDGGTFKFKGTQGFNGLIVPAEGTGTYTVNDDCSGTSIDNIGTPYNIVVADGGNEIYIMFSAPGLVITAVAKRI